MTDLDNRMEVDTTDIIENGVEEFPKIESLDMDSDKFEYRFKDGYTGILGQMSEMYGKTFEKHYRKLKDVRYTISRTSQWRFPQGNYSNPNARFEITFTIPVDMVGVAIGRKGARFQGLQREFPKLSIRIPNAKGPNSPSFRQNRPRTDTKNRRDSREVRTVIIQANNAEHALFAEQRVWDTVLRAVHRPMVTNKIG